MKFYFGNVRSWNGANLELARLHALCDIVTDYANETSDDVKVKDNNISFSLQIIHDLTAALEDEFEKLASING